MTLKFVDELPPSDLMGAGPHRYEEVARELRVHAGKWAMVAENTSNYTMWRRRLQQVGCIVEYRRGVGKDKRDVWARFPDQGKPVIAARTSESMVTAPITKGRADPVKRKTPERDLRVSSAPTIPGKVFVCAEEGCPFEHVSLGQLRSHIISAHHRAPTSAERTPVDADEEATG